MKVQIHRDMQPNPIASVTLTLDRKQLLALLDVCDWHSKVSDAIRCASFSRSREEADEALLSIWLGLPHEMKNELRRPS